MNCSTAVMYSAWKADISEISKSEPVYAVLAIISSEHTQQRIWKKLAHCWVLFIAVRMFTRHTLDIQPCVLSCECSSQTASTSDGLSLFLLALYLLWDNFMWNHQHTREQHNKESTLSTAVCAFCWHADSRKRNTSAVAWVQASNAV